VNPISAIFGAGVAARNALYERNVFKVQKLSRPGVSVGNLSVGGSGKTPFVIALGKLLKQQNIPFDVLSRGYGRQSKETLVVDPEGSPEQFGDEPLLLARRLQVPVIVGTDRYAAGLLAEQKFPSKLHLLDDGFQHRKLHRDFDIVLLPPEDIDDVLLPVGRLREPLSSLRRADAVVLPPNTPSPVNKPLVWHARRNISFVTPMSRVVAFCGIARPKQFFAALRQLGMDVAGTMAFPDHHRYKQSDIDRLRNLKARTTARGFITTDKDAINLGALMSQLRTFETAGLELQIQQPEEVVAALLAVLRLQS
jgi:tetraacyldisaccharide 4'-kinase